MEGSDDVWYEDVVIHDKLMERSLHGLTTDNQSGRIASTRNSEVVHGSWVPCGKRAAAGGGRAPVPVVAKVGNVGGLCGCQLVICFGFCDHRRLLEMLRADVPSHQILMLT